MEIVWSVVLGAISFVSGQIFQQHILAPLQEFRTQRADTIYFAVRFKDLTNSTLSWDSDEKNAVKQMRAALIYSMEMVPLYSLWATIFGLPNKENVTKAAGEIARLAVIVNSKSGAVIPADAGFSDKIALLLGRKI